MERQEVIQQLIEKIKKYPVLFDKTHPQYKKNWKFKEETWKKLGKEMDISATGTQVKRKWTHLRDTYIKHLRNKNSPDKSDVKVHSSWPWAAKMQYFKPFISIRGRPPYDTSDDGGGRPPYDTSDDGMDDESEQTDGHSPNQIRIENVSSTKQETTTTPTKMVPKPAKSFIIYHQPDKLTSTPVAAQASSFGIVGSQPCVFTASEASNLLTNTPVNASAAVQSSETRMVLPEMDATDLVFLGYSRVIKTLTPRSQAITKLKIAQVIMDMELEKIDKQGGASSTPCIIYSLTEEANPPNDGVSQ